MDDPLLLDIPVALESARLHLRCPRPGDGSIVQPGVAETISQLRRFPASLPWALAEPTVERSEAFCRDAQARYLGRTALPMLIFLKEGNTYVGSIGLHDIEWSIPKFEIGYWCRTSMQGKGLALEAVRRLSEFALHELKARRVEALPDEENHESRRLCERAGYVLEGIRRNDRVAPDGVLRSTCIFALTN